MESLGSVCYMLLFLQHFSVVVGLYEDQVGDFDWYVERFLVASEQCR